MCLAIDSSSSPGGDALRQSCKNTTSLWSDRRHSSTNILPRTDRTSQLWAAAFGKALVCVLIDNVEGVCVALAAAPRQNTACACAVAAVALAVAAAPLYVSESNLSSASWPSRRCALFFLPDIGFGAWLARIAEARQLLLDHDAIHAVACAQGAPYTTK